MEAYHDNGAPASANPYATIPPIGKLLEIICSELSIGGSFRPGVRDLARRMHYTSAGSISGLLTQLEADGWITYHETGVITLLQRPADRVYTESDHPRSLSVYTPDDQRSLSVDDRAQKKSESTESDRAPARSSHTDHSSGSPKTPESLCKDVVSSSTDHDSESTTTTTASDRNSTMLQLAELGTVPALREKALQARPDLTPQQVRDTYAHFEVGIAAGRCGPGAFHAAIARGELYAAPAAIPAGGFDPEAYRGRDGFFMGGDELKPTLRDRAQVLAETVMGKWTANNHAACVQASMFLERQIEAEYSEIQALMLLDMEVTR